MPVPEEPDLGFGGEWCNGVYFCSPVKGWGAAVYRVNTIGIMNIQYFVATADEFLQMAYVKSVVQNLKGVDVERPPYVTGLTDWLTVTCVLHAFAEEHKDG